MKFPAYKSTAAFYEEHPGARRKKKPSPEGAIEAAKETMRYTDPKKCYVEGRGGEAFFVSPYGAIRLGPLSPNVNPTAGLMWYATKIGCGVKPVKPQDYRVKLRR